MPTYAEFETDMLASGYDAVLERTWAPGTDVPAHAHPFEACALVVAGEMRLRVGDGPWRRLGPGDRFHLPADAPHAERYGPEGATYWVARKNPVAA